VENHGKAVNLLENVVVLFVHSDPKAEKKYRLFVTNEMGFPVVRVYFRKPKWFSKLRTPLRYWTAQNKAFRYVVQHYGKPDICHVHVLSRTGLFALYLKTFHRLPFLITEHWSGYTSANPEFKGTLRKWFTRLLIRQAKRVTVVSHYLQQEMLNHRLHGRYVVIPNVVDTQLFQPQTDLRTKNNATTKKFYHISTLQEKVKNFSGIVKCFNELIKQGEKVELHVIGDGDELHEQQKRVEQLGLLQNGIYFYGDCSLQEVANHLAKACSLVLFSHHETQSVVLLEAYACGVPVIATAVGGIPEHLDESRGVLIAPGDQQALQAAVQRMIEGYSQYDAEKMRAYAHAHFNEERIAKDFSTLYKEILENN
jgi:glycosyltransferase involved in cell wall biosynthesis